MTDSSSYYDVLGVPSNADAKTIRQAYLRASLQNHPDKNPGNEVAAKAKFIEIGEAYNVIGDPTKRAAYDRELATGKRRISRQRGSANKEQTDQDFSNFMDMFDTTVAGMSEEEINMAMGAASVVGGVIGSILGSRFAKGNSFLSSAASVAGSAMASHAASTLVKAVHEDSRQRVLEKKEREAAIARGETVPQPSAGENRERVLQDAFGTFHKMAEAAMGACAPTSSGSSSGHYVSGTSTNRNGNNNRMSWEQAAQFATMAAGAVAEMQRAANKQNSSSVNRNR